MKKTERNALQMEHSVLCVHCLIKHFKTYALAHSLQFVYFWK